MTGSEYIDLSDPRVKKKITREGKIYTKNGVEPQIDGLHVEPRMSSVLVGTKSWFMNPGDSASIEIEDVVLLGIVYELAEHHFDINLFIDGEDIYRGFNCISTYSPSSDGIGKIHWIMINRGKHTVRVEISDQYNRMVDLSGIKPTHACLSGFLLLRDLNFPPPIFGTWMYSQNPLPSSEKHAAGYLRAPTVPSGGYKYFMDLYGQGTIEECSFTINNPLTLEIMDGGAAEAELYPEDFPHWIRRIELGTEKSIRNEGYTPDVVEVNHSLVDGCLNIHMTKDLLFGSRLIARFHNPTDHDVQLSDLYLEGTLRLM